MIRGTVLYLLQIIVLHTSGQLSHSTGVTQLRSAGLWSDPRQSDSKLQALNNYILFCPSKALFRHLWSVIYKLHRIIVLVKWVNACVLNKRRRVRDTGNKKASQCFLCFCFVAVVVRVSLVFVHLFFALLSFSASTPKDGTRREGLKKLYVCFLPYPRLVFIYYCAL